MTISRPDLIAEMTTLLQAVVEENALEPVDGSSRTSLATPLIGDGAVLTSISLVSFIADVEMLLDERWGVQLTIVSEQALSRRQSPFRTVETMADYILEIKEAAQ